MQSLRRLTLNSAITNRTREHLRSKQWIVEFLSTGNHHPNGKPMECSGAAKRSAAPAEVLTLDQAISLALRDNRASQERTTGSWQSGG